MSSSISDINYILKRMVNRFPDVEVVSRDSSFATRCTNGDVEFRVQLRQRKPLVAFVRGQDLMFANTTDLLDLFVDSLAR